MFFIGTLLIGSALFLLTLWRGIWPLKLHWIWKLLLCLPVIMGAFRYPLLYLAFGGHFFRPNCPMWVELLGTWLFISLLMLVLGIIALDVLLLPLRLVWRRSNFLQKTRTTLLAAATLLSLGAAGRGMYNAFALPEVREITIHLPKLKQPVKLAMLTDLHADRYKQADFFREVVNRTNALEADAIVITGDFEDGHLYALAPALAPLRDLESRWGTFAVHGNHDYFSNHAPWQRYLSALGIRFLNNEHVLPGPGHLVLAGVTDPAAARDTCPPPDVARAVAGAPADKPTILLAHQPKLAVEAVKHGVQLQLSGHTHGGHAPGINRLVAHFNDGLVSGLYRRGDTQIYISNATSLWSGFPLRLFTPAEIALICLVPETP